MIDRLLIGKKMFVLIVVFFMIGCTNNKSNLVPLDLLNHGLPLKIMAPADVEIDFDDLGIIKDMTVKNQDDYSIQIFASETNSLDPKVILEELKSIVESSKFYSKMIEEDKDGFIFEKQIDDNYINYDFRKVKIRGATKYVFQTGLSRKFTVENVKVMYHSVR